MASWAVVQNPSLKQIETGGNYDGKMMNREGSMMISGDYMDLSWFIDSLPFTYKNATLLRYGTFNQEPIIYGDLC